MEENLDYWKNIREQRQEDISCENAIGAPDRDLINILIKQLNEAEQKIIELNE